MNKIEQLISDLRELEQSRNAARADFNKSGSQADATRLEFYDDAIWIHRQLIDLKADSGKCD